MLIVTKVQKFEKIYIGSSNYFRFKQHIRIQYYNTENGEPEFKWRTVYIRA